MHIKYIIKLLYYISLFNYNLFYVNNSFLIFEIKNNITIFKN